MVFRSGNTILIALLAALVLSPGAAAWAWPVDGPVLRPFVSGDDPYAGGQHRGIDIGAPTGSDVRSAARGVVSFAGRLPRQGLCLTVRTEDGWSVTLVHLGSIGVSVGTQVSEGDVVGTIGPSGEPEGTEPYVYLGIRLTADPNGYVDPQTLLPPRQAPDKNVAWVGSGTRIPKNSTRRAYFHQPITVMKPNIHAAVPRIETGRTSNPETGPMLEKSPLVTALVSPLYGV